MVEGKDLRLVFGSGDLNNFKIVNDMWTHAQGDYAIMVTAKEIRDAVTEWNEQQKMCHCVPFRFGGDEFVFAVLVPGCTKASSMHSPLEEDIFKAVKGLFEDVCKRVASKLGKEFSFDKLEPLPRDRDGKEIQAKGPTLSVGVAMPICCDGAEIHHMHSTYLEADKVLEDTKKNRKGEEPYWHVTHQQEVSQDGLQEV
eukprot:TRINITY_DN2082_c0_g1_i1.p1 TRINITY_DN2082_c0_g1~~TRINITY_DN2082_c0_g1_i1.p1  ORF type:complete len:198 (+),score=56.55 TRINITY_DN2082_c0_g1_i1:528-1121(+)